MLHIKTTGVCFPFCIINTINMYCPLNTTNALSVLLHSLYSAKDNFYVICFQFSSEEQILRYCYKAKR